MPKILAPFTDVDAAVPKSGLTKVMVGLGNADNTSDVNKPVSAAQATAIAAKASTSGQAFTGPVSATALTSSNNVTANTNFFSSNQYLVVATNSPGVVFLRPNGVGSVTGQTVVDQYGSLTVSGNLTPEADNTRLLGVGSLRWAVVYSATGSINTSDAREKTAVVPMTAAEVACAADLAHAIGTYQWLAAIQLKGAGNARHHIGLTVQNAIAIMQAHGLDPFAYGFICYDEWPESPELTEDVPQVPAVLDVDGNVVTPAVSATSVVVKAYIPAGDRYSFRTDELNLFIARGAAAERDAQAKLIVDLTARLDALEAKA